MPIEVLAELPPEDLLKLPSERLEEIKEYWEQKYRKEQQIKTILAYREAVLSSSAGTLDPSGEAASIRGDTGISSDLTLIRHEKRPRPETTDSKKAPPPADVEPLKAKATIREYTTFVRRFEIHFRKYDYWYDDHSEAERHKIDAILEKLDDKFLALWEIHEKDMQSRQYSYREFLDWLQGLIRPPELLRQDANQKYNDAKQLPNQTVAEFAAYLAQWEGQLDAEYIEKQRINHLRAKVLPAIRNELDKYPNAPETYDAYVSYLQMIEERIPSRRDALRAGRTRRDRGQKTGTAQQSRASDPRAGERREAPQGESSQRKPEKQGGDSENYCYVCKKKGHPPERCPEKSKERPEERRPRHEGQQSKN
ncbi:hypothetical protein VTN31DRAFT_1971 [Thermomyces dupontii]|uniref:uncharacterized protein n=1 Tax=Talaromyces thermophilus TaxID=28565 RepID=UPI0037446560